MLIRSLPVNVYRFWTPVSFLPYKAIGLPFYMTTTPNHIAPSSERVLNNSLKSGKVNKISRATICLILSKASYLTCVHLSLLLIEINLVKGTNVCDHLCHIPR